MKKITIILALLISGNGHLSAQTNISAGAVSGTWQKSGSPYRVQGNIYVASGQGLTITEGVVVEFQDTWKLDVWGKFSVLGKPGDSVHFTPKDKAKGWRGIRVYGQNRKDTLRVEYTKMDYFVSTGTNTKTAKASLRVDSLGAPVIIKGCRFSNNRTKKFGALFMTACKVTMMNLQISNNRGGDDGTVNPASAFATASAFWNCDIDFDSLSILNNTGSSKYLYDDSSISGSQGTITMMGCLGSMKNSVFKGNFMTGKGAGLYLMSWYNRNGNLTIENCQFIRNSSKYIGAGIHMELSDQPSANRVIIRGCTFKENASVNWRKSKIWMARGTDISIFKNSGKLAVENCSFQSGDGDFVFAALATPLDLTNCFFSGSSGACLYVDQGSEVNVYNSIFANNGLGVYNSSTVNLYNSIVVNNKPAADINKKIIPEGAFGLLAATGGTFTVKNSIITGHRSNSGAYGNIYMVGNGLNVYNSIIEGTVDSIKYFGTKSSPSAWSSVLNADPGFIAPTSGAGIGYDALQANWRLKNNCADMSPAFDAGVNISGSPATDLDGKNRTVGKAIDIGPYEIQNPNAYTLFTSEPADTSVCEGVGNISTFRNKVIGNQLQYQWQTAGSSSGPWTIVPGAQQPQLGLLVNRGSSTAWYRMIANNSLCNVSDTTRAVRLLIHPLPQPNLGPDASIANSGNKLLNPGTFNSYTWSTGATSPTLTVDKNNLTLGANNIWVQVKDANNCQNRDTVIITLEPASRVESPEMAGIRVFPVPTDGLLNIQLPTQSTGTWQLNTTDGRLLQQGKLEPHTQINMKTLPAGIYLLSMEVEGKVYGMRVVR